MNVISNMDYQILLWIQTYLRTDAMTFFWKLMTMLGNGGLIWLCLDAFLLSRKETRKTGFLGIIAIGIAALLANFVLKGIFSRPRPFVTYSQLHALVSVSGTSFPSAHTMSSFANAYVIYRREGKKYGIPSYILAGLIAFSRMYLGVHYLSDVLGGLVLGIATGILTCYFMKQMDEKKVLAKEK